MCGVVAVYGVADAARLDLFLGCTRCSTAGQEAAGIVAIDPATRGTVPVSRSTGPPASSPTSSPRTSLAAAAQRRRRHRPHPLLDGGRLASEERAAAGRRVQRGDLALAHNGNLVNAQELRRRLERDGAIFQTVSDTEVIVHLIARSQASGLGATHRSTRSRRSRARTRRLFLTTREPHLRGARPVRLPAARRSGELRWRTGRVSPRRPARSTSSKPSTMREVEPGEIVRDLDGRRCWPVMHPHFRRAATPAPLHLRARLLRAAGLRVFGHNVHEARKRLGRQLAREHPASSADIVVPVPDSGVSAALGYARGERASRSSSGLVRNHYVGRTFIEPKQAIRHFGVKVKLNPVREVAARASASSWWTTRSSAARPAARSCKMLRDAGAKEVHMRISSPPTSGPATTASTRRRAGS